MSVVMPGTIANQKAKKWKSALYIAAAITAVIAYGLFEGGNDPAGYAASFVAGGLIAMARKTRTILRLTGLAGRYE